jgi:hypothetical protein
MNDAEGKLRRLNTDTFRAEAKETIDGVGWDEFLRSVLADNFVLRRSRVEAEDEDRDEMIRRIDGTTSPPPRRLLEHTVQVWTADTLGVVKSVITLPGETGDDAYQNIKLFVENDDMWSCVYWQVTARPRPKRWGR